MASLKIAICNEQGIEKYSIREENHVVMVYEGAYEFGDKIVFQTDKLNDYYVIRVDSCMDEAYVYLTKPFIQYEIPFNERKVSYNPAAFSGSRHYITMRRAEKYENICYRNLAKNVMDQQKDFGCYPHAHANVETRGEAVFAARNCIDGILANCSHGPWPYGSWGINMQEDAEITVEFGRLVNIERIYLYTRADFPHDNWWTEADIYFSDGSKQKIRMCKSIKPHIFNIEKEQILWVKLSNLIKSEEPSPFPALTQIEIYGTNS